MDTNRRTLVLATCGAMAAQSLAACGGGGGGSPVVGSPGSPAPQPPTGSLNTTSVTLWSKNVADTFDQARTPLQLYSQTEARLQALVFAAIHDTLNAIERRYQPWKVINESVPTANPDAAVATAARDTLVGLMPARNGFSAEAVVQPLYQQAIDAVAASDAKTQGIALGQRVAKAILDLRANDGAATGDGAYTDQAAVAGMYQRTPRVNANPVGTETLAPVGVNWGKVTPFVITAADQFKDSVDKEIGVYTTAGPLLPSHPDYGKYAGEFDEVSKLGALDGRSTRTAAQSETAQFWIENCPPQWHRVAVSLVQSKALNGWDEARLFAAMHLAMADSLIACFEAKYRHNYWRPITAIRFADDGNAATTTQADWLPKSLTPNTPDYPSAHGAAGGAAAEVLVAFAGTNGGFPPEANREADEDSNEFTMDSKSLAGKTFTYRGYRYASRENALSRKYAGFHFRKAVYDGRRMGRDIGLYVMTNALRPV
jgi:hypothetical protein